MEGISSRKRDHIELALLSQVEGAALDQRFNYEPLLSAHPSQPISPIEFLGKKLNAPIWISSMTGGTEEAAKINRNLARVCQEFGLGMGLGSCRILLEDERHIDQFDLRSLISDKYPFFANLGISQIEHALADGTHGRILELVKRLEADGLIIHVNPLQEWLQDEGDELANSPIETIRKFLEKAKTPVIVKEVGQGMGPGSLKALLQLPLAAIEFGAHGGTNFSKVELQRGDHAKEETYYALANVGHSAAEMVDTCNRLTSELGDKVLCDQVIISGGVKTFLDGYYLRSKIQCTSVYGQGAPFLEHARDSYEALQEYVYSQIRGLQLADAFLTLR